MNMWVDQDEHQGLPSMDRPDAPKSRWSFEAIAAVERPHDLAVSPDGSRIAFILDRDTSDVWTVPVAGGLPTRVTTNRNPMAFWEDTTPAWSPDGRRLAYDHDGEIWLAEVGGGKAKKLAEAGSPAWIDDETLLVTVDRDDETRLAVMSVDDSWPVAITPKGQNVSGGRVVPGGGAAVYLNFPRDDRNASEIWWVDLDTKETRKLTGVPGMHDFDPQVSPDGSALAFVSERSGWCQIHLLELATGSERQLTEGEGDFGGLEWHPSGDRLVATRARRGRSSLVSVSPEDGTVTTLSEGGNWTEPHWVGDSVVAVYEDHLTPVGLVEVDSRGGTLPLLGPPPTEIQGAHHVPFEEVTFQSFDGLEIHGFLYRPAQTDLPVPAVVYPHGGPTDAYGDFWDGHAQYFVDKGYAWLAINFRGSTTYGRDFERANHGVWGVADTKDCLAAHDFLAGLGWVDPKRIAIFGASYGSYMALASMTNDSEHRFKCAVLKYGDSDITSSWAHGDRGGREDLERMMGTPAEARDAYRAGSPLWSVANIEGHLLIAHGDQDARVHPRQSAQLVEELKKHDKPFEYVTYPTEGHGLLRTAPQVDFYRRLERFLDWHLM